MTYSPDSTPKIWNGSCDMQPVGEVRNNKVAKKCSYCGLKLPPTRVDRPVRSQCRVGPTPEALSTFKLLGNYSRSITKWLAAGRPKRTDEEVAVIMDICGGCPLYKDGGCQRCGCRVNKRKSTLLNKVRMATEECPIGKW